jgi:hypothetical protein
MLYTSIYILKSILIDMKLITQIKILTITSSLPRQVNQNPNIVRVGESLVEHREQQHIKELNYTKRCCTMSHIYKPSLGC